MKRLRRITRREIEQMARHFERRARGAATATELAARRTSSKPDGKRLWTDVASVNEALALSHALYEGGQLTWDEFFFHSLLPVESLHDHLMFEDHRNGKLKTISEKLTEVEKKHDLKPDEYWPRGKGPAEHKKLNARYERVLDTEFAKLLRKFDLATHARLWRGDREEFNRLREAGRASVFESSDLEHATVKLVEMYEGEAAKCVKTKAYYAACVMLGSASEARILLKCLQNPAELATAKAKLPKSNGFHKGGPAHWNLGQLIEIANQAGWVADLQTENIVVHIVNLIGQLHDIRNLVHPGRHAVRRPHVSIGREQYADAKSAYSALRFALDQISKSGKRQAAE